MNLENIIPKIKKALEYSQGEYQVEDVLDMILRKTALLWELDDETVVITQILVFPRLTRVHIFLAYGNFNPENMGVIEDYAKSIGAQGVQWSGRKGWTRHAKPLGYNEVYNTVAKDFKDE